jgi:hypothetical protein
LAGSFEFSIAGPSVLIGGAHVSVRRDPILSWRATVITAPKHAKAIQERADAVAAELRKKFTLKE